MKIKKTVSPSILFVSVVTGQSVSRTEQRRLLWSTLKFDKRLIR